MIIINQPNNITKEVWYCASYLDKVKFRDNIRTFQTQKTLQEAWDLENATKIAQQTLEKYPTKLFDCYYI